MSRISEQKGKNDHEWSFTSVIKPDIVKDSFHQGREQAAVTLFTLSSLKCGNPQDLRQKLCVTSEAFASQISLPRANNCRVILVFASTLPASPPRVWGLCANVSKLIPKCLHWVGLFPLTSMMVSLSTCMNCWTASLASKVHFAWCLLAAIITDCAHSPIATSMCSA